MRRCGRGRLAADAHTHGAGMSSVGTASPRHDEYVILALAQLAEHLIVDICSSQMVPGSIPGRQIHCS